MPEPHDTIGAHPQLPTSESLDLDDLLAEIRVRAAGAQRSQERLAALLDAVVAISSHLDLRSVLTKIVDSARSLVDAEFGALGVVDDSGQRLVEFVTSGMDPHLVQQYEPPVGRGILGLLLRHPRPWRISSLPDHPASVGFPEWHPPMQSFLGAPICVRDRVFGNVYLTDKKGGIPFTEDDEAVLTALAAAAGIAIDNAQMYRQAAMTERWTRAMGELTQTLLEGRHEGAALARMPRTVRQLAHSRLAAVAVRQDDGRLVMHAVDAVDRLSEPQPRVPLPSPHWAQILASRVPLVLMEEASDVVGHHDLCAELRRAVGVDGPGVRLVCPVAAGETEVGLLFIGWSSTGLAEALEVMDVATVWGERLATAVAAARALGERSRTTVLEDRDRIARDMHDHVIQRLYAAGLSLKAVSRHLDGHPKHKVDDVVHELDQAVKDIRQAIFELHHPVSVTGVGPAIEDIVEHLCIGAPFVLDVAFIGPLSSIPVVLESEVLAVVREGLTNVVKYAGATQVELRVSVADAVTVLIRDNGCGINPKDPHFKRSGLANLAERAEVHRGVCVVSGLEPQGTQVEWSVPLS